MGQAKLLTCCLGIRTFECRCSHVFLFKGHLVYFCTELPVHYIWPYFCGLGGFSSLSYSSPVLLRRGQVPVQEAFLEQPRRHNQLQFPGPAPHRLLKRPLHPSITLFLLPRPPRSFLRNLSLALSHRHQACQNRCLLRQASRHRNQHPLASPYRLLGR